MGKTKKQISERELADAVVVVDEVLSRTKAARGGWSLELLSTSSASPPNIVGHGKVPASVAAEIDRRDLVYASDAADITAGDDLLVTLENEGREPSIRLQRESIMANIEKKLRKGTYDPSLAVALWRYLVDAGAKFYAKTYADERQWSSIFSVPTRDYVARRFAREFEAERRLQNESDVSESEDGDSMASSSLKQALKR